MRKYIKITLLSLLVIIVFASCDNDATSGILSNIVNSEIETTYNIKAVTNNNNILYSVEDDGIYKTTNASENVRTKILDSSEYNNIENIYYNSPNLYFIANNDDASSKVLYYLNPDDSNPTPQQINISDNLISLSSNGYIIFKNDSNYYFEKISGTTDIDTSSATSTGITSDKSLSLIIAVGDDELYIQTVDYDVDSSTYNYYFINSTQSINNVATNQTNKIVSAVKNVSDYFCVLNNGDLIKIDVTGSNQIDKYYEAEENNYSFNNLTANMHFETEKFLVLVDSSNYVLLYDLNDSTATSGCDSLTEGFANLLKNTSDVVYIKIADNSSSPQYKLYVATNSNGYYTITIDDASLLDDNESENSSYIDSLENI